MRVRQWRRLVGGLHYLRTYGITATWHRVFPRSEDYRSWVAAYDTLRLADIRAIQRHIADLPSKPLLSIIMPVTDHPGPATAETIASVTSQLYPAWELCVVHDSALPEDALRVGPAEHQARIRFIAGDSINHGFDAASGDFVLLLMPGDRLARHALYMVSHTIISDSEADIIYSDEDTIDRAGRRDSPKFKTDWNPDLFLSCNMIGRLAAYRRGLVDRAAGRGQDFPGAGEYDLNVRLVEQTQAGRIRHIPMVLYHRRSDRESDPVEPAEALAKVAQDHFQRREIRATAIALEQQTMRIQYPLPAPEPGVSVIIPIRDRVGLLRDCIDGLTARTKYSNMEIIIVDNDSELLETHSYLESVKERDHVNIVKCPGKFNYSSINNFAVTHARNQILAFLNSDIQIIEPGWLREMAAHAVRPEIGVVGAKLLYANDTIQHAGTVVGLGGLAGHAFRHFGRNDAGYLNRLRLTQNISAVTAACMLIRKSVFEEIGGFDEVNLPVAYSDVDLCLRVQERGYRNLWTPYAELYHLESQSRPSDFSPERISDYRAEAQYLRSRWRDVILHDPFYNPNLTNETESFGLAYPPRVRRPWQP